MTQYAVLIHEEDGALIYEAANNIDRFKYDYFWKTKTADMVNGPFASVNDAFLHYKNFKACISDDKTNVVFVHFRAKKRIKM
jgi:hypothetical protein